MPVKRGNREASATFQTLGVFRIAFGRIVFRRNGRNVMIERPALFAQLRGQRTPDSEPIRITFGNVDPSAL